MSRLGSILLGSAALIVGAWLALWFIWRTIKKSEDPARILFKWVATAVVFGILIYAAVQVKGSLAVGLPVIAAAFGVVLGIIWAPHLGAALARPFTSFYDGGDAEPEQRPFYSIARAKQKHGHYPEAIAAIRGQLAKFPQDYEGWMFLAEIHGDNLKDNLSAQECIDEILSHTGHAPKNITFALNRAADWHLHLAHDRESARARLERICDRFPDTEFAHAASQRIAHLTSDRMLFEQKERPLITLVRHEEKLGLQGRVVDPRPQTEAPDETAARLVRHLDEHPLDMDAREELARIYAHHYHRIDLAADQLEQLIAVPGASQKHAARWLNLLADFHLELGPDRPAAENALHRLIELYPGTAVAANAETRIAYMDHELRKSRSTDALKLGSYDQNIGLSGQLPKAPRDL